MLACMQAYGFAHELQSKYHPIIFVMFQGMIQYSMLINILHLFILYDLTSV